MGRCDAAEQPLEGNAPGLLAAFTSRDFFDFDGKAAHGTDFIPGGLGAVGIDDAGDGFPLGV
jgi:hypothetical protein